MESAFRQCVWLGNGDENQSWLACIQMGGGGLYPFLSEWSRLFASIPVCFQAWLWDWNCLCHPSDLCLEKDMGREMILLILLHLWADFAIHHGIFLVCLLVLEIQGAILQSLWLERRFHSFGLGNAALSFDLSRTGSCKLPSCLPCFSRSTLGEVIKRLHLNCKQYADDTQLYLTSSQSQRTCENHTLFEMLVLEWFGHYWEIEGGAWGKAIGNGMTWLGETWKSCHTCLRIINGLCGRTMCRQASSRSDVTQSVWQPFFKKILLPPQEMSVVKPAKGWEIPHLHWRSGKPSRYITR